MLQVLEGSARAKTSELQELASKSEQEKASTSDLIEFPLATIGHDASLFPRLVLGCINTDFGNQIVILQHFSRSTRFAHFCTARNSKF